MTIAVILRVVRDSVVKKRNNKKYEDEIKPVTLGTEWCLRPRSNDGNNNPFKPVTPTNHCEIIDIKSGFVALRYIYDAEKERKKGFVEVIDEKNLVDSMSINDLIRWYIPIEDFYEEYKS